MANSVFVSREDTFPLTVFYTSEGDFAVKKPEELTDEEKESEDYSSITIKFSVPDHATAKVLMRRSTTFVGSVSSLDQGTFSNMLFEMLAKSWDLKDENGKSVEFDAQKMNDMRPDIVRAFIDLLQEELDVRGLYMAVLQS